MKILGNIWKFFSKNKKNIAYIAFFLVFLFSCNDFAFAAEPAPKEPDWVIKFINWILGIAASLIWVLTMLIWLFLRPEWTSGSVIWLDTQLKTMWILISNIVYFVFAFIFVTIAFMNIVWWSGDNYELKKAIPKFIVWVLIVPFSWFFVQFILSLSSILTVAVLSLPFDSFPELDIKSQQIESCINGNSINLSNTGANIISCKWATTSADMKELITIWEFIKKNDNWGLYSIMTIYTYWVMKLDDKWILKSKELLKWIQDVWSLWLKWIFDLIFIVVYGLLCIALFLAFMTRWFALWFYMMFSPVFWLLYYLWKKDGIWSWATKSFNLHEFIALAFVPVYVAGALSFWLLFLLVAGKWFSTTSKWPDALISFKWDELTIWNNTFTSDAIKSAGDKWFGWWFTWPIGAMILEMLWLAVMWMAVMAALKSSTITASVTDPIEKFGDSIWELIKKAPTYAPILPGGMSVWGLAQVWSWANQYFSNKSMNTWQEFMKRNNLFQNEDVNAWAKMSQLGNKLKNPGNHLGEDEFSELSSAIKSFSNPSTLAGNTQALATIKTFWEKLWVKDADKWTLKNPQEVAEALREINNKWVESRLWNIYWDKKIDKDSLIELTNFIKNWKTTTDSPTPWNWPQTININTGSNASPVMTPIDITLNNWAVQWELKDIFKDLGSKKYTNVTFKTEVLDKIPWLIDTEKTRIIAELEKISWFFNKP